MIRKPSTAKSRAPEPHGFVHRLPGGCIFAVAAFLSSLGAASSLVDNSPFIPEGFKSPGHSQKSKAAQAALATRDLEFLGVYSLNDEYRFNIYNRKRQSGEWVRLNDPGAEYRILRFDEETSSLQINIDGQTDEIFLKERDGRPLPVQLASTTESTAKEADTTVASATTVTTRTDNRGTNRQPVVRRQVTQPNRAPSGNDTGNDRQARSRAAQTRAADVDQIINELTNQARMRAAQRR